jgi:hypothetical protein
MAHLFVLSEPEKWRVAFDVYTSGRGVRLLRDSDICLTDSNIDVNTIIVRTGTFITLFS